MDSSDFVEFVLGKRGPVVIEQWTFGENGPKATRQTVPFEELERFNGAEDTFFVPHNGVILTLASDTDSRKTALPPSFVTVTNLNRFNSYYRIAMPISRAEAMLMLTYLDPLSPPRVTETFRLPGTVSTKQGVPFTCEVVEASERIYTPAQVFGLPAPEETIQSIDPAWLREPGPFPAGNLGKAMIWLSKRPSGLGKALKLLMEKADTTPNKLIRSLSRAGLTEKEIIWCCEASACNPYKGWRYGAREEIAKIILITRAQAGSAAVSKLITTIRGDRADKDKPFKIRAKMSAAAMLDFQANANILHASEGSFWAVDKHTGIALPLLRGSDPIKHYINSRYGINPVDQDHGHLLEDMMMTAAKRPNTAETTAISYYEKESNRMLVSYGGREIAVLTQDGMELQENGTDGIIFRPVPSADVIATKLLPVDQALQGKPGEWWDEMVPLSSLFNLTGGDPEEFSVMLHVWTLFFMFRNIAGSRPILACLGPMGAGKTTLSKKLNLLQYGRGVKLFQVKDQDSWDTTASNYPLALYDNVDSPTPWWLPPKLAISISPTDSAKRALWSNNTPYIRRCDAMVGVSSHDASFLKEDVIDRMILLQFSRIADSDRLEETPMLDLVATNRERFLAGLMAEIIMVLRTPKPAEIHGSVIRIVDFAAIGTWIARALGKEKEFAAALGDLSTHQVAKMLEEDMIVVTALEDIKNLSGLSDQWITHNQIWTEAITLSDDGGDTLRHQYKNAQVFGRKLLAIYTQLRDAVGLQMKQDPDRGWSVYRIVDPKAKA